MYDDNRPFNWTRFFVHFFFGAILGALAGLRFGVYAKTQTELLLRVGGAALTVGLIAGFLGDRFWGPR